MKPQQTALLTVDGKPVRGFLADWMNEKANAYVEPTRKGTPRGQEIGFSKKKYIATLLEFTNLQDRHVAKQLGVSFGVLRVWKTEDKFWEYVAEHHQDLHSHYLDYIKKLVDAEWEVMERIKKLPLREFANANIEPWSLEYFQDRFLYNPTMSPLDLGLNPFGRPISQLTDKEAAVVMAGMDIARMVGWEPPGSAERVIERILSISDHLKELFVKDLSVEDRRHGLVMLRVLEANLGTVGLGLKPKPPQPVTSSPKRRKRR